MPLTKEVVIDQIIVNEAGFVSYREVTRVLEDTKELAQSFHRVSLYPGQDLTNIPDTVAAVCNAVWTPEVITAFQEKLNNPSIPA